MSEPKKWTVRKHDGLWYVWRPQDREPVMSAGSFAALREWRPDCESFLRGYCRCWLECGR